MAFSDWLISWGQRLMDAGGVGHAPIKTRRATTANRNRHAHFSVL